MFNVGRRSSADGRLRKLIEAAVFGWFVVERYVFVLMYVKKKTSAAAVSEIEHFVDIQLRKAVCDSAIARVAITIIHLSS